MSEPTYIVYTRSDSGTLTRDHVQVTADSLSRDGDDVSDYRHREQLVGWPERKVFWALTSGGCLGIAPRQEARS